MKNLLITCLSIFPLLTSSQEVNKSLAQIESQLKSKSKTVSEILMDPNLMSMHSLTEFRDVIKRNAKQEKITLVGKNEPGIPATISVKLKGNGSVAELLVYVYHTDHKGWYSDTGAHVMMMEGDRRHARLFGYLRSDVHGQFEFTTIHPQGYPRSDLPQHIHLEVYDKGGSNLLVTELLFDDDERLKGNTRARAIQEGFLVAKNEGKQGMQVYSYTVSLR